jgi:hypothetical protein
MTILEKKAILQSGKQKRPCQYTVDEVKESVKTQLKAYREGCLKTTPHEDVLKMYAL